VIGGLRGACARFAAADGFFLAAGLAFFFSICMIPLTLLGVSIVGFVLTSEQAAREVVGQLTRNFPVYRTEVSRVLLRIVQARRASGVLGTLTLVLFSTPLFGAARLVMHRMLGIRRSRGFVRNLFVDTGMVLLLALLLFAALAATWVLQALQEWLLVPATSRRWLDWSAVATSLVVSTVMFYLGYRYVPYRRTRVGAALAGGVMAAVLWEVAKQLFRLYIRQVGLYDQIYGPLGVLIAFVMFVYYSAVVFVFGAAYVAALDARR
jgi:membrane protein